MSYTPQPGTVAFRAIAHLETLPRGAELMTSALAEAIGCDGKNIVPSLEAALASGLVFRRQRDNHLRSPMWWSLVDHGARPKMDIRRPAVPVANGHAELHVPTFKDSSDDDQRGVAQQAARRAHNPEVGGSNPPPASNTPREPGPQQVLKAEPATADATDRGAPAMPQARASAQWA